MKFSLSIRQIWVSFCYLLTLLWMSPASAGFMDKLNGATQGEFLTGQWRVYLVAAALVVCGLGWGFNFLSVRWMIGIIGGSFLIAGAQTIAETLFGYFG